MSHDPQSETRDARDDLIGCLHRAWVERLHWHYTLFNELYLGCALRPALIMISRAEERLGQWNGQSRTISISESHILTHTWEEVLDTLRHEMAHQYVDEIFRVPHAPPHGELFVKACRLLRCDPDPSAPSGGLQKLEGSRIERDRMLSRIKELMALAGSPNEHEAANAMRMAQRYLLKYNIDLAELEGKSEYGARYLGNCLARVQEYHYTLSSILQEHFFVLSIWTFSYDPLLDRPGRILQISGTPENLEMASYVYDYILHTANGLWRDRQRASRSGARSATGTKLQYFAGLLRGFQEKLAKERDVLRDEHGLVWTGDSELMSFYRNLHPRVRSVSLTGVSRNGEFRAGMNDGKKLTIRRGISGSAHNRGRFLPGPGS